MEKIFNKVCCLFSLFFFACSPSVENGIKIIGMGDSYALYIDGKETYIKGVGGTYRLDIAAQSGANAFRHGVGVWWRRIRKPGIGFGAQHVRNAGNRHDQRLHTLLR